MTSVSRLIKTTFTTIGQPFLAFGRWLRRKVASLRNVRRQNIVPSENNNDNTTVQDRHITLSDNEPPEGDSGSSNDSGDESDDNWDMCDDAYSETVIDRLLTNMQGCSELTFCEHLRQLAQKLPAEEIQEVLYSVCQDIANQCLSSDRLDDYRLSILLSHRLINRHKSSLITALQHACRPLDPPLRPNSTRESEWSRQYHADMQSLAEALNQNASRYASEKYPLSAVVCSQKMLADYYEKPETDAGYDTTLTAAYNFLEQLKHSFKDAALSDERKCWLEKEADTLQAELARSSLPRLPTLFEHGITEGHIFPEQIGLDDLSTSDWEDTLRYTNGLEPFGKKFDADRLRDNYLLADASQRSEKHYCSESNALSEADLLAFTGDEMVTKALSKIATQTFPSYMINLEMARLQQVTPLTIPPMGQGEYCRKQCIITRHISGDYSIGYHMTSSPPDCVVHDSPVSLSGMTYTLFSETTFDGECLKQGILSAAKPIVQITFKSNNSIT